MSKLEGAKEFGYGMTPAQEVALVAKAQETLSPEQRILRLTPTLQGRNIVINWF